MTSKKLAKSKATRTKRAAEKPVDAEIKRAAERARIPVLTPEQEAERRADEAARGRLVKALAPDLVLASEYLSEELAAYEDAGGGGDSSLVRSALHRVWQIRWNLGLYAGAEETVVGGAS